MTPEEYRARWHNRVDFCIAHTDKMSDWEVAFVDDMNTVLDRGRDLTLRQSFKLNEVYHKVQEAVG